LCTFVSCHQCSTFRFTHLPPTVGKVDSEKKVKGKVIPRTDHEGPNGGQKYISNRSVTAALDRGVGGPGQSPAA
jgi:hypothetical protein